MKKILCIFFPMLAIEQKRQLLQTAPGNSSQTNPILLTSRYRDKELVYRRCPLAKNLGIQIGMGAADACAMAPNATVLPFSIKQERALLQQIAKWATRFSPLVEIEEATDELDPRQVGIHLDITASLSLYKGEQPLLAQIDDYISSAGFSSRYAITPTLGASWAISRYHKKRLTICSAEDLATILNPLSISALRLNSEIEQSLREIQITAIGRLLNIPRHSLAERYGKEMIKQLDQLLSTNAPLTSLKIDNYPLVEEELPAPIYTRDGLLQITEALLTKLLNLLQQKNLSIINLIFSVITLDKTLFTKTLSLSFPSSDHLHLWKLLKHHCDSVPYANGIERLRLIAKQTQPRESKQTQLTHSPQPFLPEQSFGTLLDNLVETLGEEQIFISAADESHYPEKVCRIRNICRKTFLTDNSRPSIVFTNERPSLLFSIPQPIRAISLLPDHPPAWLEWKSNSYRIITGIGPERIAPQWWGNDESLCKTRDYFRVQLPQGTWVWIFRELSKCPGTENPHWFVHGIWA